MYCNFGKESRNKSVIFFHIEFFKVKMMFKECVQVSLCRRSGNFRVKNISCVNFMALNFRKADRLRKNFNGCVKLRWRLSNESCVSAATTCTSAFGRLLWERFFTVNESRQTVETNIRALNFRKPGHLRKYCNNENFAIYGTL